eukprot:1156737-Pelagomonas_calceolata.AAC.2
MNKAEAMSSVDFCISCALTWWLWCATLPGCAFGRALKEDKSIYSFDTHTCLPVYIAVPRLWGHAHLQLGRPAGHLFLKPILARPFAMQFLDFWDMPIYSWADQLVTFF